MNKTLFSWGLTLESIIIREAQKEDIEELEKLFQITRQLFFESCIQVL